MIWRREEKAPGQDKAAVDHMHVELRPCLRSVLPVQLILTACLQHARILLLMNARGKGNT